MKRWLKRGVRHVRDATAGPRFKRGARVQIGQGVSFGRGVVFRSDEVVIGDGCRFRDDIVVEATRFSIGDFGTIYSGCHFPGPGNLCIGHNFWLGRQSIVDCQGGTTIGNNVGIGAQSQLWTHMKYGDLLAGCRFHSVKPLVVEDDVWLVGHCLVSPVHIGHESLAMLGSVVTRDMQAGRSYGGVPAKDLTDVFGPQFEERPLAERVDWLEKRLRDLEREHGPLAPHVVVTDRGEAMRACKRQETALNVADRHYTKLGTSGERRLISSLLPDAKFIPYDG